MVDALAPFVTTVTPWIGHVMSLILLLPVASFLILVVFGKKMGERSSYVAISAVAASFLLSIIAVLFVMGGGRAELSFTWLSVGDFHPTFGLLLDPLSAMMLIVVTLVSMLVQIFSVGYMHGDKRIGWFFACLSMFTASMLLVVYSPNFAETYIAWEGVGVFSYLLIGFWFEKRSASQAAKKAFMVTRVGDLGFAIGLILLYVVAGTLDMNKIFGMDLQAPLAALIAILIFCGAVGKSAQFPLHVWLPDAMEGPTPVSALIHAATMVAAGVYLVARSYPLFEMGPVSLEVVAIIGTITAFIAASIALTATDIKRVLAYSTVSQLGYMMMGLGVGAFAAGMFHLFTHAFFKALLFLGAGSVIHAVHSQEIHDMGGLGPRMKITSLTFIIGGLALAGVPPFSGFWSKDEILLGAYTSGHTAIFWVGILTALLTAFYTFRLIFIVFFGKPRGHHVDHVHESPPVMSVPLIILGTLALVAGMVGSPYLGHFFQVFITNSHEVEHANMFVMGLSIAVAITGIFAAWLKYGTRLLPSGVISKDNPIYKLLVNKYYFDELYYYVLIKPTHAIAKYVLSFDQKIIDGAVNGVAWVSTKVGSGLRQIQTGYVQNYALYMLAGLIVLIIWSFKILGVY
ncbi:MAG: NADH-quinone oxidoreductase subunit L [Actinomycetota bacterium]|nr:NADH-quinone oxidoreductase subunit L [Actinomycetota bacterium]